MKYLLVVGDGMADYPVPELGNKTPLQAAYKPNMDSIAAKGRSGLIKTVPDELTPGSDAAICSVLGYDPIKYCTGRGPLEAPSRGIKLAENDTAYRCNLITEKDGAIADYSAGHITTDEASQLIAAIRKTFEKPRPNRILCRFRLQTFLDTAQLPKPRANPMHPTARCQRNCRFQRFCQKPKSPEAEKSAQLLRDLIEGSRDILRSHPVNVAREKAGKHPGNLIWPWGGGKKPSMPTLKEKYGIKSAVISAVDLVKGIGTYAGMEIINVQGATGLDNTNYEGKADAALKALKD